MEWKEGESFATDSFWLCFIYHIDSEKRNKLDAKVKNIFSLDMALIILAIGSRMNTIEK